MSDVAVSKGHLVRFLTSGGEHTIGVINAVDDEDIVVWTKQEKKITVARSKLRPAPEEESGSATMWDVEPDNRTTLTDGTQVYPGHRELRSDGQQKGYIVLSEEERAKGFVRPVRTSYIHTPCGSKTTMGLNLAETYARDPHFYSGTFCCACGAHFPLKQFVWDGTSERLGT